jgi:acetyl-CoA carboxylase beta subunit
MAWFRKEKKPRQPRRERLEIPPDTWEKCEACGHTDIRDKFLRNLNVCPECDYHRRVRAWDYATMLLDDGSIGEVGDTLRSVDPLGFPDYPARLKRALANAGDSDAILTVTGLIETLPVGIGIMDFAFMGGSMGSVVGEKIARLGQRSLEKKHPLVIISASGGARMQEGVLSLCWRRRLVLRIGRTAHSVHLVLTIPRPVVTPASPSAHPPSRVPSSALLAHASSSRHWVRICPRGFRRRSFSSITAWLIPWCIASSCGRRSLACCAT